MNKYIEFIGVAILLLLAFSFVALAFYVLYVDYNLEMAWHKEFKAHNGTCFPVDKLGIIQDCQYKEDSISIINSESKCYRNEKQVNCSEIQ